ncbi:metal ABC transporter permease [uncultured Helcococcus sp.]|uniref:metal ABC transporter permease n=1 Tax=uncultured Helcococcus sp. TaxID=1072508 RepID=UPI00288BAE8E|nr:metal ABC transporter permease [uncultured Helcococcus sp.]
MIYSLLTLIVTALACSVLGVFLVLRRQSMLTDAISHSVLLGIVLAFFITKSLDSPFLLVSASISGLVAVLAIEKLGSSKYVKKDDAVGIIYPMFFSIAVILISRYAKNAHLDTDIVLLGEVIFVSLDTYNIFGMEIAKSFVNLSLMFLVNIVFIKLFFKELKVATFDIVFAKTIGIPTGFLFYSIMVLTSATSVMSFNAVGSILVVSFFITSASIGLLLGKSLSNTLIITCIFAIINSIGGFTLAYYLNVSMSGMVAFVSMVNFLLTIAIKNMKGKLNESNT